MVKTAWSAARTLAEAVGGHSHHIAAELRCAGRTGRSWGLFALAATALVTASCSGKAAEAEERYRIVTRTGSSADRCKFAKEVAEAHLQANNEAGYRSWRATAQSDCDHARIEAIADGVLNGQ